MGNAADGDAEFTFLNGSFEERNETFLVDSEIAYVGSKDVVMFGRRVVKVASDLTPRGYVLLNQRLFHTGGSDKKWVTCRMGHPSMSQNSDRA